MTAVPSIKGSVFAGVVEDVKKLLVAGAVSVEEADRWLEPGDHKLLASPISISSWYDIRAYTRMNELLRDVEGGGDNQYLRERGRETARRLLESGLYAQLEFLHRVEVVSAKGRRARFDAFGRDLRKLATISGSILNFSRWTAAPDAGHEGRYRIDVTEAAHFPEVLCWRSDGFVNEMGTRHGEDDLWGWECIASDHIVFRMLRAL
jgi:hypothetical protein